MKGIGLGLNPVVGLAPAEVLGVMVKRPPIDRAEFASSLACDLLEEASSPAPVVDVWARADKRQLLSEARDPGRESPEFRRVFLRSEVSSASPRFVTHAPIPNVKGLFESRDGPHIA